MLVKEVINNMETEFMFWIENRMTTVVFGEEEHLLAHYISNVSYPRPGIILIKNSINVGFQTLVVKSMTYLNTILILNLCFRELL